jgi:hypothetical protein
MCICILVGGCLFQGQSTPAKTGTAAHASNSSIRNSFPGQKSRRAYRKTVQLADSQRSSHEIRNRVFILRVNPGDVIQKERKLEVWHFAPMQEVMSALDSPSAIRKPVSIR